MRMSIEKQIRDYKLWLDAQDFIADAPRYYANEIIIDKIQELYDAAESDSDFVSELAKVMIEFRDER